MPEPASAAAIKSLSRMIVNATWLENHRGENCVVCIQEYTLGESLTDLRCGHFSHHDCLSRWLENNGSCPLCKMDISQTYHDAVLGFLYDGLRTRQPNQDPSPLASAAITGDINSIKMVLAQSFTEVESSRDSKGRTALMIAALHGHDNIVDLLLGSGVDTRLEAHDGRTPLAYAAVMGHIKIVEKLLESPAVKPDWKDLQGMSPFSLAAGKGYEEIMRLLFRFSVEVDTKNNYNQTPLLFASERGHKSIVKFLLVEGADPNTREAELLGGRSPLAYAAANGHITVVELLLQYEAEVNSKDARGWTPLMAAAATGHLSVTEILLDHGADANMESIDKTTALRLAAVGHCATMQLLLVRGAYVNPKELTFGLTPLAFAAANGSGPAIELLLKQPNIDVNSQDHTGRSALSWAAGGGHEAVVKILLQQPTVQAELKDSDHRTPLQHAAASGHGAIVRLLLSRVIASS